MIKTLVAIEVDLASSLAIRYACQLGCLIELELYPVYVKEPPPEVPTTGTGWVRHTWEREILEMGREEIQEMLAGEMESCPQLQAPRVLYGDREYELLKIMEHEPFDLYVEGAPYPFTPGNIQRRLNARFYQRVGTPIIWLRILKRINQVLVPCFDPAGARSAIQSLKKIWAGCSTPLHFCLAPGTGDAVQQEVLQGRETLQAAGCQTLLRDDCPMAGAGPAPEALKDYGLVVVALERVVKKDSPRLQWLAQVKAPLMLVLY
ncbi:MAG: universal stress protein [Desulfobaccales bacterium]|jgi:hypothetical protein